MILALKFKVRKKFTNHSARKTTDSKHCTLTYRQSHKPQKCKFLKRLRWRRWKKATMTLSCNTQTKLLKPQRWEKANIGSFRHHSSCGLTRPSTGALKKNKLPSSFSSFKSPKKFIRESSQSWGLRDRQWQTLSKELSKYCLSSLAARSVLLI